MGFTSFQFILFLSISVALYYGVPQKVKNIILLFLSFYFYICFDVRYILILIGIILISYYCAIVIDSLEPKTNLITKLRKITLVLSTALCIGILFLLKYLNFSFQLLNAFLGLFKIQYQDPALNVILPVGISFYTLQAVGYVIDVYKGKCKAEWNIINYALYVSFFLQIMSGPIGRSSLLSQYKAERHLAYENFTDGLYFIIWGFFLKLVISDRVSIVVNNVFDNYYEYGGVLVAFSVILYALQLYSDFYGYSCIAFGGAKLFGINLPENFNTPYLSCSVREFWRRWHITLSSWLRDYIYFPLGGSRCKKYRHILNIFVVFLVSGIWHGANLTFVVWGLLHGLYQVIEIVLDRKAVSNKKSSSNLSFFRCILTFIAVDFAWLFFRAPNVSTALDMIKYIFYHFDTGGIFDEAHKILGVNVKNWIVVIVATMLLISIDILRRKGIVVLEFVKKKNIIVRDLIVIVSITIIYLFGIWGSQYDVSNFIYTQF